MNSVGILYDSVSLNTGDMAIGIALEQVLKQRGVQARNISPYDAANFKDQSIIIGGGQLLREPGDSFYDLFRLEGAHLLNSVGVSGKRDFGYLNEYSYISARTSVEAKIISKYTDAKVNVLPCTTTMLKSETYTIPGLRLRPGEKVVGIHLVPDTLRMCPDLIETINRIPHKKVFIPFTHYNCDESFMKNLPIDKSNAIVLEKLEPLQLHSVISQMSYTIVSSLHATIFSFTQNVPFVTMYQKKTFDYLKDRRLEHFVFRTQDELDKAISMVEMSPMDFTQIVDKDKKRVNEAIDLYVEILSRVPLKKIPPRRSHKTEKAELEADQLRSVVEGRDVLLHNIIYQKMRENDESKRQLQTIIDDLSAQLQVEKDRRMSNKISRILTKMRDLS